MSSISNYKYGGAVSPHITYLREGWLSKESGGKKWKKNWKDRYFTVDDHVISYFKSIPDPHQTQPQGVIGLCEIVDVHVTSERLEVVTLGRTYSFKSLEKDSDDLAAWEEAIMQAFKKNRTPHDILHPAAAQLMKKLESSILSFSKDVWLASKEIPERIQENSRVKLMLPANEKLLAFVDNTIKENGTEGVAFCMDGIYWRDDSSLRFVDHIEYDYLPELGSLTISEDYITDSKTAQVRIPWFTTEASTMLRFLNAIVNGEDMENNSQQELQGEVGDVSVSELDRMAIRRARAFVRVLFDSTMLFKDDGYYVIGGTRTMNNAAEALTDAATKAMEFPAEDSLIAWNDASERRSGSEGVLFGEKGMYWMTNKGTLGDSGFLLYPHMIKAQFQVNRDDPTMIESGIGHRIPTASARAAKALRRTLTDLRNLSCFERDLSHNRAEDIIRHSLMQCVKDSGLDSEPYIIAGPQDVLKAMMDNCNGLDERGFKKFYRLLFKLKHAKFFAKVPALESPAVVVDCSLSNSGKDCIVFSMSGVYWHHRVLDVNNRQQHLLYSDFPDCEFEQNGKTIDSNLIGASSYTGEDVELIMQCTDAEQASKVMKLLKLVQKNQPKWKSLRRSSHRQLTGDEDEDDVDEDEGAGGSSSASSSDSADADDAASAVSLYPLMTSDFSAFMDHMVSDLEIVDMSVNLIEDETWDGVMQMMIEDLQQIM